MGAFQTYRGTVYPWHCDHMGHMNVMHYVGKFDEATWHFFSQVGLTTAYFREHERGMAAVEQHLHYFKELHAGDLVEVRTEIEEVMPKGIRFVHKMLLSEGNAHCAECRTLAIHINRTSRRSASFPDDILATIKRHLPDR